MFRIAISLMFISSLAFAAENPETFTERSHTRALATFDKAVEAIGGAEALQSIDVVKLQLRGDTWPRLQMTTPEPPFEKGSFDETLLFDLKNNRLSLEQRNSGAGFNGHNRVIISGGEGTNYDLRGRTATPIPAGQTTGQQFVQYYRRLPNLLLRQALDRTNTLRHLGEDTFDGRKHDVITFVMPDTQQVALYVDSKSALISKYELVFTDPLTGDEASEIMFSDYTTVGALKAPRKWGWRIAGETQASYDVNVQFNPAISDASFQVAAADFTRVTAPPATLEASVERLGQGVHVIHNVAGNNQNTLAVEFSDFIIAVEAPGSSAGAESVIKRIKETIPGKPIRYVAMTHHHGDHIGGLRAFIAEGATVVTTPSNRKTVEVMAAAPQSDRLAKTPRKLEFAFIENGRRVFSDGTQRLELIDIGPNPHAREMVIAWLPKERVVFQGDLFALPNNDAPLGPAQNSTLAFAQKLREKGLDVTKIASVHGRTASIDDLRRATEGTATAGGQ